MHGEDNHVRQIRGVANTFLIDCVQQNLKSYGNYEDAAQLYLANPLAEYLKIIMSSFLVIGHLNFISGNYPITPIYTHHLETQQPQWAHSIPP